MNNTNMCDTRSNRCIECSVNECANHSKQDGFCALDKIKVGSTDTHPTDVKCTMCGSFSPIK